MVSLMSIVTGKHVNHCLLVVTSDLCSLDSGTCVGCGMCSSVRLGNWPKTVSKCLYLCQSIKDSTRILEVK